MSSLIFRCSETFQEQMYYAASTKIRSVIGEFSNAMGMTFMTFVGQNYGAQKYDRIKAGKLLPIAWQTFAMPMARLCQRGGKTLPKA